MNERTKTGFEILQVALILGVLGDVLLRQTPWGLNVLLFNLAFAAGMIMIILRHKREFLTPQSIALFGGLIFFASMFVWRDSIELRIADTVGIVAIMSVLFVPQMKIAARVAGVFHYFIAFLWSSLDAFFAPFVLLTSDIAWTGVPRTGVSKHLFAVMRGLFIVTPILLVFGGLFVAADAAYQGMVQRIFNIKPEVVFTHVLLFSVFAWMSAGYLRGILLGNQPKFTVDPLAKTEASQPGASKVDQMRTEVVENPAALPNNASVLEHINRSEEPNAAEPLPKPAATKWEWAKIDNSIMPPAVTLGSVEVGVIFGLIDLLFLSFVVVQIPYLFGGMDLVQNTPDFKLAEYARRGFGELVTVSALVLPILLAAHWLVKKESPLTEKLFRVLAGIQIVLLFVIMASAVQRLVLLTGNLGYGLTTIRLYPMILMGWLAVVFVWFALTVLRGSRQYFAWGALWSALLVVGATHFLNPDAFIVKTNIALMQQGRAFDANYNSHLSDDAVPALVDSFSDFDANAQTIVYRGLANRYCKKLNESDLRSWNLSRQNALLSLEPNREALMKIDCTLPSDRDFEEPND